jgi:hypothetical protein
VLQQLATTLKPVHKTVSTVKLIGGKKSFQTDKKGGGGTYKPIFKTWNSDKMAWSKMFT